MKRTLPVNLLPTILFAVLGFAVMGYHPGAEDDAIYLAAIKADLNPALYPHDAAFFQLQLRTTVFDTWMARFIHLSGMPLAWAELLGQALSILLVVWAAWQIVRLLFRQAEAQWAGVALLTAMFTIPVAGTALYIMDQYLHPRNPATALILLAVWRIMARKRWQAAPLLALAFLLHPMMAAFGISFCCVLALVFSESLQTRLRNLRARPPAPAPAAALIPFAWIFRRPSPIWLEALQSRHGLNIYRWTWYEWLGAIAPLLLFWLCGPFRRAGAAKPPWPALPPAVFLYGVFQQAVAMVILAPSSLTGFAALEPMRYLQLVYIFMALVGGAYLGQLPAQARLLALGGLSAGGQRRHVPGAAATVRGQPAHRAPRSRIEPIPGCKPSPGSGTIRPQDAYFALDPQYMAAPGEDYHSFRALAERSQLADAIKDTSVVTKVPELAPAWQRQVQAQKGWTHFKLAGF